MSPEADFWLRNGLIYDGGGGPPVSGDVVISGDRILAVGAVERLKAQQEIDLEGSAVAPGFINMLSWACESLILDGNSHSEIRQGVTLEVMGEGLSFGPLNDRLKKNWESMYWATGNRYELAWTSLGEYLDHLVKLGVSPNVASFVGSGTLRKAVIGEDDRPPTPGELEQMCALVQQAMQEGALGLSSALIYPPNSFAETSELIALARAAAQYGGMYISHIRDEGGGILEALEEFLTILAQAGVGGVPMRGEIYHLKTSLRKNWPLMDAVLRRISEARQAGFPVTADVYPYAASATGLKSILPDWAFDGGEPALLARLQDQEARRKIIAEITQAGSSTHAFDEIMLAGFANPALQPLTGKTLAEVVQMRAASPGDVLLDLLVEDHLRTDAIYFSQSEENVRKVISQPWVSFCSDAESLAPVAPFLKFNPHPRTYGSFARLLGKYVREEGLISLEEAIRRLTSFPAENLRLDRRGRLLPGYYADVVVFDPAKIQDHATFLKPHQYATGVRHVWVNGSQVLLDGEHTGRRPGRVVRGPGYTGRPR